MENWNPAGEQKSPAGRRGSSRFSILYSRFYMGVRFFEKQSLQ
jgi:hypothetical protein